MNLGYEERAVPHRYRQFKFEGQNAFDSDESEPWCACVQVSPHRNWEIAKNNPDQIKFEECHCVSTVLRSQENAFVGLPSSTKTIDSFRISFG